MVADASARNQGMAGGVHLNRRRLLLLSLGLLATSPAYRTVGRAEEVIPPSNIRHRLHIDAAMIQRIKSITNVFEVGSAHPDFGYIEDLGDGRGFTLTQYGFVTNELEARWIIERYTQLAAANSLTPFLAALPPNDHGTDSTKLVGLPDAWRQELARGPELKQACEEVADRLYFNPAMEAADIIGVTLPVGRLIFYDTILQHGGGNDPDSFGAITKRARTAIGTPKGGSESGFLSAFLSVRRNVLSDPANTETAEVWRKSVDRVEALSGLLENNPGLKPPVLVASKDYNAKVS